jgi:GlpG protein
MHSPPDLISHWRRVPITVLVLTLSGVVLVLMEVLGEAVVLDWLAFNKVEYNGRRFELVSPGTDYWRYVSPALVHFGVMHIVFNALWIWEFGSRLELRLGSIFVLNLFLAGAVGGNLLQYWWAGPSIFGGLSGVVFTFMWIWLLVGFTDVLKYLGLGSIANGAHLGGLLVGIFTGVIIARVFPRGS